MNVRDTDLSTTEFDSLLPAARLDRRGFVTTVAAAGFALAVQPVQASTVISTDAAGLDAGNASVKVSGGVFLSWRLFGTDPSGTAFNLYRDGAKINSAPISTGPPATGCSASLTCTSCICGPIPRPRGG